MLDFIQNEIFGIKWLNRLIGSLLNACGLDTESKLGGSLQFFIYDTLKIMVLLVNTTVHGLHKCRTSSRRDVFVPYLGYFFSIIQNYIV